MIFKSSCCVGGAGRIDDVFGTLSTQFTTPQDHLGNMAFARKMIGHLHAIELEQIADYARSTQHALPHLEVAALLHISDRAAERRITFAVGLTSRLPHTLATLKQGCIEEFRAQLIAEAVAPLSDEHALAVENRVLAKAPAQTPTQLRNALTKVVLAVDPQGAEERRQERVRDRRGGTPPTPDALCQLDPPLPSAMPAPPHPHIFVHA